MRRCQCVFRKVNMGQPGEGRNLELNLPSLCCLRVPGKAHFPPGEEVIWHVISSPQKLFAEATENIQLRTSLSVCPQASVSPDQWRRLQSRVIDLMPERLTIQMLLPLRNSTILLAFMQLISSRWMFPPRVSTVITINLLRLKLR